VVPIGLQLKLRQSTPLVIGIKLKQRLISADKTSMETQSIDERPLRVLRRVLVGLGCVLAFMVMASVFSPSQTRAVGPQAKSVQRSASVMSSILEHSTNPHEGLRSIGTIDDCTYTVHIYATDLGPRYTIIENATGNELGQLLSLEQVEMTFPELPLRAWEFNAAREDGPFSVLMLATERDWSPSQIKLILSGLEKWLKPQMNVDERRWTGILPCSSIFVRVDSCPFVVPIMWSMADARIKPAESSKIADYW
jgi:hypothetical protein